MPRRDIAQELAAQGYEYLGGTAARAHSLETGEVISRRQWEALLGTPLADEPITQMRSYNALLETYMRERRPDLSRNAARRRPEFRFALKELRAVRAAERRAARSGRPWIVYGRPPQWEERLRAALGEIGRRNPDWTWAVGETPT